MNFTLLEPIFVGSAQLVAIVGFARQMACATTRRVGTIDVIWTTGDVVRKLRVGRRWSQKRLAEKAGLNRTTINQFERGKVSSDRDTEQRIYRALNIAISDVYRYVEWLNVLRGLDEPDQGTALRYAQRLASPASAQSPPGVADPPRITGAPLSKEQKARER